MGAQKWTLWTQKVNFLILNLTPLTLLEKKKKKKKKKKKNILAHFMAKSGTSGNFKMVHMSYPLAMDLFSFILIIC